MSMGAARKRKTIDESDRVTANLPRLRSGELWKASCSCTHRNVAPAGTCTCTARWDALVR